MKKFLLVLTLLLLAPLHTGVAEWEFPFVVYEGKVYEVTDEPVPPSDIGTAIGEVSSQVTTENDDLSGNASNIYPVGTIYFDIASIDRGEAIAVEISEGNYVKAIYTSASDGGFNIWTVLLVLGVVAAAIVITISFKSQRDHLKKYRE